MAQLQTMTNTVLLAQIEIQNKQDLIDGKMGEFRYGVGSIRTRDEPHQFVFGGR